MSSPAIYGGSRTKILTSKGLLLKDGTPIDFNGPKNYITKGTFPINATTGWSLKRTTLDANKVPNQVAASWTNPSVLTLTATSTGALTNSGFSLSLAASAATTAGDMLVSDAYTIDKEDQAKVLNFKFSYQAYANASNLNFSGTSSNTLHVYIYDATSGQEAWIQPTGCYTMVQNSGVGIGYGTFQTPSNMTSFRIALVSANASAGAFTLYTDNFFVGPQQFNMGPPVTDWVSYTPTISGGGTANPIDFYWRRVGGNMEVKGLLKYPSVVPTGVVKFTLPSGYNVDKSKLPAGVLATEAYENIGIGTFYDSSADARQLGSIICDSTSTNTFYVQGAYTSASPWGTTANGITVAANDAFEYTLMVPIAGWSSNTIMSSDAATNVVAFVNATTSLADATTYNWGTAELDTANGWNGSTTYKVPVSGIYKIGAQIQFNITASAGQYYNMSLNVNGVSIAVRTKRANGGAMISDAFTFEPFIVSLKAGDEITLGKGSTNYTSISASTDVSWLTIERISGPAQIAASETVAALYKGAPPTGSLGASANKVTFGTKIKDSHSAYSSGVYTVPTSGVYDISAQIGIATTITAGGYCGILIAIDGADSYENFHVAEASATIELYPAINVKSVPLLAGQTVQINSYTNGTSLSFVNNGKRNWFSITKSGNY